MDQWSVVLIKPFKSSCLKTCLFLQPFVTIMYFKKTSLLSINISLFKFMLKTVKSSLRSYWEKKIWFRFLYHETLIKPGVFLQKTKQRKPPLLTNACPFFERLSYWTSKFDICHKLQACIIISQTAIIKIWSISSLNLWWVMIFSDRKI